ncbi:MAG: hypothetical protein ACJAZF_003911 [Granulosicoccus sp.]|jgi:hypothetical protein
MQISSKDRLVIAQTDAVIGQITEWQSLELEPL